MAKLSNIEELIYQRAIIEGSNDILAELDRMISNSIKHYYLFTKYKQAVLDKKYHKVYNIKHNLIHIRNRLSYRYMI